MINLELEMGNFGLGTTVHYVLSVGINEDFDEK